MPKVIKVNGVYVEAILSPQMLEMNDHLSRYRNRRLPRNNTFRTNPLKFIQFLTKHYNINWTFRKQIITYPDKSVKYKVLYYIEAMNIIAIGIGDSIREAKRTAVFDLHKKYCSKITNINFE